MMNPLDMVLVNEHILNTLVKHQNKCGSLEELKDKEEGAIRCTKCGLTVIKREVPIVKGKGFTVEYY